MVSRPLSPDERHQILVLWNATEAEYSASLCIHELFERQVEQDPLAAAVICKDHTVSYGQLNDAANRLAHYLRNLGVRPDHPVGICVDRSLEMVVGLVAILKAGGAYVPLDPAYPAERLAFMLQDCQPRIVLTHGSARASLEAAGRKSEASFRILDFVTDASEWATYPTENPNPKDISLTPVHLAYVIYTSGSTGEPKGVAMQHAPLVNLIMWHVRQVRPGRTLQFSSISFDASFQEIFSALSSGVPIVVVIGDVRYNLGGNLDVLAAYGIENIFAPQPVLEQIARAATEGLPFALKGFFQAGEALRITPEIVAMFRNTPGASLYNYYGPSETHVATAHRVDNFDQISVPIGRPISNVRIYILDNDCSPVPVGVVGEIYIGGACVARGYFNRPGLTAERFLDSPFVDGDRLYKTGDLGRYLPDGNIEFLGRSDFQIKIRGFRVELGEIEACLLECPGIRGAIVLAREDEPGDKRLVAYYKADGIDVDAKTLRQHMASLLPEYMVPAAYIKLEHFPLTPSGKIDRTALPLPDVNAYSLGPYEAPDGPLEATIASIWAEVLKIDRIGRYDNFLHLGGHSLLAVRLMSRVSNALDVDVPLDKIFLHPILWEYARSVRKTLEEIP